MIIRQDTQAGHVCWKNTLKAAMSQNNVNEAKRGAAGRVPGRAVLAQLPGLCAGLNPRPASKTCFLTVMTFLPAAFPGLHRRPPLIFPCVCFKSDRLTANAGNTASPGPVTLPGSHRAISHPGAGDWRLTGPNSQGRGPEPQAWKAESPARFYLEGL